MNHRRSDMKVRLFGLSAGLSFVLLIAAGSINSAEIEGNNSGSAAGVQDYEEVFSAGDSNGVVYIDWLSPKATNESACAGWFLGAYKFVTEHGGRDVSEHGSENGAEYGSLCVDLDRKILLTNNLVYALHYSFDTNSGGAGFTPAMFIGLLDTNGAVLVESDNLLTSSNIVRYVIPAEAGIQSSDAILLVNVPTAAFLDADVIQLRSGNVGRALAASPSSSLLEPAEIIVYEGLIYIDEDGDGLTADMERTFGTSDYSYNVNGGGISNYCEWGSNSTGSVTNNPGDGGGGNGGGGSGDDGDDDQGGHIIYVDQAIGNDAYSGRNSAVGRALAAAPSFSAASTKGPKKTVRGGLEIAGTNDTLIIRTGNYNENLNISGKDVKVVIEGKVKL